MSHPDYHPRSCDWCKKRGKEPIYEYHVRTRGGHEFTYRFHSECADEVESTELAIAVWPTSGEVLTP